MKVKTLLSFLFVLVLLVGSVSAFTQLALSRVAYSSNDEELNRPAFSLFITEDGRREFGVGTISDTISNDEINSKIERAERVRNDLTIKASLTKSFVTYSVRQKNINIKSVQQAWKKFEYYWNLDDLEEECRGEVNSFYFWKKKYSFDTYCFVLRNEAEYGFLQPIGWNFNENFFIEVDGDRTSLSVSNDKQTDESEFVHIAFTGSLSKGLVFPNPNDAGVGIVHTSSGWKSVDKYNVETNYAPYFNLDRFEDCLLSKNDGVACMKQLNDRKDVALRSKGYSFEGKSLQLPSSSATWGSGVAKLDIKPLENPTFRLRVYAETLGIFLPVGKPKIVDASSECFEEGTEAFIIVDVENIGEEDASFESFVKCNFPFEVVGGAVRKNVDKGRTVTFRIPIEAVTDEVEFKSSCIVKIMDSENSKIFDQETVTTCVENAPLCSEGEVKCEGRTISKCNSAGNWKVEKVCDEGQKCEGKKEDSQQVYVCTGEGGECSSALDCPAGQSCKSGSCVVKEGADFGDTAWIGIGFFVAFIVFMFFAVVTQRLMSKYDVPKKFAWMGWVASALIGIVVGFMIWNFREVIEFLIWMLIIIAFLFIIFWFFVLRKKATFGKYKTKLGV